jgi:hypothetical protein
VSDFVPQGLNDRSDSTELAEVQAIYCLEPGQHRSRPVGDGVIGYPRLISRPDRNTPIGPNHTVPYGTVSVFAPIPGNKLPGYLHSIPTGQKPYRPIGIDQLPARYRKGIAPPGFQGPAAAS